MTRWSSFAIPVKLSGNPLSDIVALLTSSPTTSKTTSRRPISLPLSSRILARSDWLTYPSTLFGSPFKGEFDRGPDDEEAVGDFDGILIGSKEIWRASAGM